MNVEDLTKVQIARALFIEIRRDENHLTIKKKYLTDKILAMTPEQVEAYTKDLKDYAKHIK